MPETLIVTVPVATVWTEPDAPRELDEAAVRDLPDLAAWTAALADEPSRAGLTGRTLTQVLLGDPVQVLEERHEWARVVVPGQPSSADPGGYPGWVRLAHLHAAPFLAPSGNVWTVVSGRIVPCVLEDGERIELSLGTLVSVEAVSALHVLVALPDGRRGTVAQSDVLQGDDHRHLPLEAARAFLGTRYLWGGTSGWGVDCSGLVHLAFRLFGVVLPRDAHDQSSAAQLRPVPLDEVRSGDLYFFAEPGRRVHHVGFASRPAANDGTRWLLHAPGSAGIVEDVPMSPDRVQTLVSAGRVDLES
jgi:hypothetical protein